MRASRVNRKIHYWISLWLVLPIAVVSATGLLLQLKKQVAWVQPREVARPARGMAVTWDQLLATARTVPELEVSDWSDVPRIEARPGKGLVKLVSGNGHEAQFDAANGELLQVERRRSDLIEAIHDGSWFGDGIKLGWFASSALVLLVSSLTGTWLFLEPYLRRTRRRARVARDPRAVVDDRT